MDKLNRLYRKLLVLYPASFRDEYSAEMRQSLRDRGSEARYGGMWGRVRLFGFVVSDLARSLPASHLRAYRRRRANGAVAPRRSSGLPWAGDIRLAMRGFIRRPGFFLAAVLTLGLGVGASTTVFSVADGVALRALPYPDPDRLVVLGVRYGPDLEIGPSSPPDFFDLRERTRSFEYVAASRMQTLTLTGAGEPRAVQAAGVSASYFGVLGVQPSRGRAFTEAEDVVGATPVAVMTWSLWQNQFGGDPGIPGRVLDFDGRSFTVVGIMPRDFHPPEAIYHGDVDLWFPLSFVSDDLEQRSSSFLQAIARLAPGVTLETATADLARVSETIAAEHVASEDREWSIAPLRSRTAGDIGTTLFVLLAAVGLVLLIACANVANLFLVRATERSREMALRTALGARRGVLVRMLLAESFVLTLVAAGIAVLLAWAGVAVFRATNPGDIPRLAEVTVDVRVFTFALVVSMLTGVVFALVPAIATRRSGPGGMLREGTANLSASRRSNRLRGALVIGQTAIALILLVGAALLIHSFVRLNKVDPGFVPEDAVWMQVRISGDDYATPEARHAFFTGVLSRFAALPGVEAVGGSENMPMGRNSSASSVSPQGLELAPGDDPAVAEYNRVTEGFFEALRTPVVRGRGFNAADDLGAEPVAIVSQSLASRFWPQAEPIGQRIKFGRPDTVGTWMRVVGVAADLHQRGLGEAVEPQFYIPWRQSPRIGVAFVVRSRNQPAALLRAMREQVWSLDPTLPITEMGTLESHVAGSIIEPRFYTLLLSTFATLALILAFVGLYGVIAYTVEQRTREIGVRMALGADPGAVTRLMVGRGMGLTLAGLALGMTGVLASTRALQGFVFGITPRDPLTLGLTATALAAAALVACWLPARRASRLDPARTLRAD